MMQTLSKPKAKAVTAASTGRAAHVAQPTGLTVFGSPRPVTRGETPTDRSDTTTVKIDWLNATFVQPDRWTPVQFIAVVGTAIGRQLSGVQGRGMFGFEHGIKLFVQVGSISYTIGTLAWGGEAQKGRCMLQLTGAGCAVVRSWARFKRLLVVLDARITRVDLAADFLDGQYSVDDAVRMYQAGEFNNGGRSPSSAVAGDWFGGALGRTLYVGKATNGKMLRVYEKGRQMGQPLSEWVRFEVQLGNRDRVIPLEVLVQREEFMAGCYPALRDMLGQAGKKIDTTRAEVAATVGHLMHHLKKSYGKVLGVLADSFGASPADLIDELRIVGTPRGLKPDAETAKLTWAQLLARCSYRGKK